MKLKLQLLALLITTFSFAQIPSGYYNTATGTGYTLKTQLYNKIKGHSDKGYAGLWTTYSTSDRDKQYENDNTIIDIYSERPTTTDSYTYIYSSDQCGTYSVEGNCYNREHIVPQSVFNESAPMVSDAHHIPPTDGKVNGMRANYPHGNVATATWTSLNGSKLGSSAVSGYSGTVFEPINEFKGDVARMYFYFATRYENTIANYDYDMFNGTSNQVFTTAFRDMLLAWHAQDPVSAREIARNNAIYVRQGNRNPYIDHPEYVNSIWGTGTPPPDTQAPTAPTNLASSNITQTTLSLNWTASTDNIAVTGYDVYMNGSLKTSVASTNASITGLTAATTYSFYVTAKDAALNVSAAGSTINTTTSASGGTITELYFSEYLEGSSNNKAVEIANTTGSSISLSTYSIKKQTNGAGSWSAGLTLSGTIANGAKYVIVNSSISSACYSTSTANISTSATEMAFNGNDAVGLFKNGVLIDIIGTFNGGTSDFSIDETLRRKASATVPKTIFSKTADWDIYSTDTCSGFGNKSGQIKDNQEMTGTEADFKIYPNPSNGNFSINLNNSNKNYTIEIFTADGRKVFEKENTTSSSVSVSNLQKGIYLIKLTKDSKSITKKMVIN